MTQVTRVEIIGVVSEPYLASLMANDVDLRHRRHRHGIDVLVRSCRWKTTLQDKENSSTKMGEGWDQISPVYLITQRMEGLGAY